MSRHGNQIRLFDSSIFGKLCRHVSDGLSLALASKALELSPWTLRPPMPHYNIYRDHLSLTNPSFGYALWSPTPESVSGPVKVGDVGYVREGRFFRLFNVLLPADDPSHQETPLPEYYEPLIPNDPNQIARGTLKPSCYCSAGVSIAPAGPESLTTG